MAVHASAGLRKNPKAAQGKGGESFQAPTYACRPPGVYHGPFKSEKGCMLFEIHYYDESKR